MKIFFKIIREGYTKYRIHMLVGENFLGFGLALAYRYTKEDAILPLWRRAAGYFVSHLPADHIPYWDLCFTQGEEPRDTSAAAIAVCGILEMNEQLPGAGFMEEAQAMLHSLAADQTTEGMDSNGLLKNGMYGRHRGDKSECNIWGDYFFLEALLRSEKRWDPYW